MPLETWDVVVHGRSHRLELDRNVETGKHFLRIDGRMAVKPFVETTGDIRFDVDGKPFALRLTNGRFALEDKGSRYHDASAPRASAISGRITIRRGLEHITIIADDVLLRIEKLSEGYKSVLGAGAGGGLIGAIATEAVFHAAQKLTDSTGPPTIDQVIRSFVDLESEVWSRFVHLPTDLIALFSDEVDPSCRVLVVPRHLVKGIEMSRNKMLVETGKTRASGAKPFKFELISDPDEALDHLCGAMYPLAAEDLERASPLAREERQRRTNEPATPAAAAPPPAADPAVAPAPSKNYAGVAEVRWTAPLATFIGRDPELIAQAEGDASVLASVYPKTVMRRVRVEPPMRRLGSERYDIVFVAGVYDDKTRFREVGGYTISLKDLIVQLYDQRVRMLWLASANDDAAARETLEWVGGLNFYVVLTTVRADDYRSMLEAALARLAQGEALAVITPELEKKHQSRWLLFGGGEAVFLPK